MLKSRFAKLGAAGFAAAAAVILVASSVGAHHSTAPASLSSLKGLAGTTQQLGTEVDQDAAAEAAALTAEAQAEAAKDAAEKAAAQQKAAADNETGDTETETDTETGDTETGVQSGDDGSEAVPTGPKGAPKTGD
jgi:hypothetical protein